MRKFAMIILLAFVVCPLYCQAEKFSVGPDSVLAEHGLGALIVNPDTVIPEHRVNYIGPTTPELDIRTNPTIRSVINSAGLPPVRSQGSQGSCTSWASAYYHRTHLEWREKNWDVNLSSNQCSPAFLYHHINGGSDTGSYIHEAMEFLCTLGCASLQEVPYSASDATSWPTSTQTYRNALQLRAWNYSYLSVSTDAGITNLKQHIANGGTAVIAINVYSNFDYISNYNNTYCVSEVTGTNRGAHAVTIYGFDDDKQTSDGAGAFRLVNSWGTSWGDAGHFWMSYAAVKSTVTCYPTAYFLTDRTNYTPALVAEVKVQHNARGEIMWNGITAGIGNLTSPQYSLKILDFNSIQAYVGISNYQRHAFPNCNLVVDLSDGIGYINHSARNRIFVKVNDAYSGTTGSIQFLNATDYSWGITNVSDETPVSIPDAGSYVYANVTLEAKIVFEHTPPASVLQGEPIPISVRIASTLPLSGVWLYYKPVNEVTWYAMGMSLTAGNSTDGNYTATIPAQSAPGTVEYYFYAVDSGACTGTSSNYTVIVQPAAPEGGRLLIACSVFAGMICAFVGSQYPKKKVK
ncbi:MAG: C1 family peptidase [Thermoplasmata archaeon]|nr:C1 family peptidase [Thermoplasmata archaeon]